MESPVWTSVEELPDNKLRRKSPRVQVDLVPPAAVAYRRLTVRLSQPWMMVAFEPLEFREALDSDRFKTAYFSNRSHFLPGGTSISHCRPKRRPEFLAIHVDDRFTKAILEEQLDGAPLRARALIRNARPSLLRLCEALRNQILEGRQLSVLQLESFAVLCLAEWRDDLSNRPAKSAARQSQLKSLTKIEDYIAANLDQDVSLEDLAEVAGFSPSYFLRAFKNTTRRTPHRHLMERRVQRACELLRRSDRPLAEITYTCGFASQSHMTDVFKRHMDLSPGRYRREHRAQPAAGL